MAHPAYFIDVQGGMGEELQDTIFFIVEHRGCFIGGLHLILRDDLYQYILSAFYQLRPLLDQRIGPLTGSHSDIARHGKDLAPLFQRIGCSNKGATVSCSLHDHHPQGQTANNPIPLRKVLPLRRSGEREFRDDCTFADDIKKKVARSPEDI